MSSAEVDGMGTPEDSSLSWEGTSSAADETKEPVIATEEAKPTTSALFQGNGLAYETRGQRFEGAFCEVDLFLVRYF